MRTAALEFRTATPRCLNSSASVFAANMSSESRPGTAIRTPWVREMEGREVDSRGCGISADGVAAGHAGRAHPAITAKFRAWRAKERITRQFSYEKCPSDRIFRPDGLYFRFRIYRLAITGTGGLEIGYGRSHPQPKHPDLSRRCPGQWRCQL